MTLFGSLEFREPVWLFLTIIAPLIYMFARRSQGYILYSSTALLNIEKQSLRQRLYWLPAALFALSGALLAIAAAGPRVGDQNSQIKKDGIAIMMIMKIYKTTMKNSNIRTSFKIYII